MEQAQQEHLYDNINTNQQPLQGSWTSEEPYPPVATHGHVLSPWRYNDLQAIPQSLPPVPPQADPQPQIESGFSQNLHWIPQSLPPVPPQADPQPQIESGFGQAVNDLHWQQSIPQPLPPAPLQANPQPQIESGFSQAVNAPSNQGVTLEKVHPTQGPTAGGVEIWVAGRNFYGPLYVRFGDRSAPVAAVGVQSPSFIK